MTSRLAASLVVVLASTALAGVAVAGPKQDRPCKADPQRSATGTVNASETATSKTCTP